MRVIPLTVDANTVEKISTKTAAPATIPAIIARIISPRCRRKYPTCRTYRYFVVVVMALASFFRSYVPGTKTVGYRWWFIVTSARCEWPLPCRSGAMTSGRQRGLGMEGKDERGTAHPIWGPAYHRRTVGEETKRQRGVKKCLPVALVPVAGVEELLVRLCQVRRGRYASIRLARKRS